MSKKGATDVQTKEQFTVMLDKKCQDIRANNYMFACLSAQLCSEKTLVPLAQAMEFIEYFLQNTAHKDMLLFVTSPTEENQVIIGINSPSTVSVSAADCIPKSYTSHGNVYMKDCKFPLKEEPEVTSMIFAALRKTPLYPEEPEDDGASWDLNSF